MHARDALAPQQASLPPLERPIEPWDTQRSSTPRARPARRRACCRPTCISTRCGAEPFPLARADDRYWSTCRCSMSAARRRLLHADQRRLDRASSIVRHRARSGDVRAPRPAPRPDVLLGVMATFLRQAAAGAAATAATRCEPPSWCRCAEDARGILGALRLRHLHRLQHDRDFVAAPCPSGNPAPLGTCGRPRPGVEARRRRRERLRGRARRGRRTDPAHRRALGDEPRLSTAIRRRRRRPGATAGSTPATPSASTSDGNYFFVDRMKDAIRRRGENISSFEVETEVCAHPAVREAAAVARAERTRRGRGAGRGLARSRAPTLDPAELIGFLMPRMAHFMVPRYVRIVRTLPQDADAEGREAPAARRGHHRRHLGSREGRHQRQARAPVGLTPALLPSCSSPPLGGEVG